MISEELRIVGNGDSGPRQFDLAEVSGKVDFGIVTIREDEFRALLHFFPMMGRASGRRQYSLSRLGLPGGKDYVIAMLRCAEQGGGEAQAAAHDMLEELKPRWLLVVGIAGGRPSTEFGLGDVVVSTRVHDFSVEAVLQDGEREYNLTGGPLHPAAKAIAADLPAREQEMQGWNSPAFISAVRPSIVVTDDRLEGPINWKEKVKDSLSSHVARNKPLVTACPIASSDRLVRDPELLGVWLKIARHVCAVEMESAGIYRATHGPQVPFLAIRGISDVVGFKRDDPKWTEYACYSAAAFTHAFLRTRPIAPKGPSRAASGDEFAGHVDEIPSPPNFYRVTDYISGHKFVGRTRELLLLDDWATDPNHAVLMIESIGGMGKSMLAWQWVHEYAAKARADWAGRLWYSFYERGADVGDFCAHALAYTTGRPLEELRKCKTAMLAPELIQVLHQRPWLFVLDGLERVLVAYHRFDAAQVQDEDVRADPEKSGRSPENCIRREDDEFLRKLCSAGLSKLLMSSRLMPASLLNNSRQPLPCVRQVELKGLDPADAEGMMRDRNIQGSSSRIQTYLEKNCACHPLVVGAVAGLVANYRPAPNDFDRWADDPQGGTELNIAQMELVQKRNHILEAAFNDLTLEARVLLGRIGLISDAVDLATIEALNPHRPEPPKEVDQLRDPDWEQMQHHLQGRKVKDTKDTSERKTISRYLTEFKERYRQKTAPYDRYLRELAAWQESSQPAFVRLQKTLGDLEARGLLQWDRGRNLYDLHPVVRGYAVSTLSPDQRSASGQKVVDYFSSRHDPPYDQAVSLDDLRNTLQVVRTLLQIGRHQAAARLLGGGVAQAMLFNLERYHDYLALARPLFAGGWSQLLRCLPSEREAANFAAEAGIALYMLDKTKEAIALNNSQISVAAKERWVSGLLVFLGSHVRYLKSEGRLSQAKRALTLAQELSSVSGEESNRAFLQVIKGHYAYDTGDLDDAEAAVREFRASPHPARPTYRAGEMEDLLACIRLRQGRLDEGLLSSGMRAALEGKDRSEIRCLHELRGEWLLTQRRYIEAQYEFEEAFAMAREVGLPYAFIEARIALARTRQGDIESGREAAQRLAGSVSNWALAELYLALGDQGKAKEYALKGHESACAEGTPYVYAINLQRNRAVLDAIGVPPPRVPAFDESKAEPLPFESEVRAFIEELKQKAKPQESE